jgi:histidinol-phosphate aminotransferase/imidazoleglycerol-phosphate dehydratase/histidinol-phosphatase
MTSLAKRLARPEILALPETNAIVGGSSDYDPEIVRLHLNESGFVPLVTGPEGKDANRYPEPSAPELKRIMAALYGVEPNNLLVTRGADDAIDLLLRTFCRSGVDSIAHPRPTFGAYGLFAQIQGAGIRQVPLKEDFSFDAGKFLEAVGQEKSLKLVFLCSPNNPTGNTISSEDVLALANALPETILVLDEAYIEFSDAKSLAREAATRDNLVVLRTLSKAYGIAGARVGCAIASPELIAILARALPPFPISSASLAIALATLDPSRRLVHEQRIAEIRAERDRMADRLTQSPFVTRLWPSETNFLLMETHDLESLAGELGRRGIRIRFRPDIGETVIRLSIGTRAENSLALAAFGLEPSGKAPRRAELARDTNETRIAIAVDLDRPLPRRIQSGVPFFDHMLDQVAAHGGFSLVLGCDGDTSVDAHHSIEDVAISFGKALSDALGDKRGIGRFGFALPMDEAEAQVLIDLSGRPYCRFEGEFGGGQIGDYPTEMTAHVFRSIADGLGAAIHVRVDGTNDHHKTESCFKAFGRALRQAIALESETNLIPSTKGAL